MKKRGEEEEGEDEEEQGSHNAAGAELRGTSFAGPLVERR